MALTDHLCHTLMPSPPGEPWLLASATDHARLISPLSLFCCFYGQIFHFCRGKLEVNKHFMGKKLSFSPSAQQQGATSSEKKEKKQNVSD